MTKGDMPTQQNTIQMPGEDILLSQAAVLPGGFDKSRHPVIILPPSQYPNLFQLRKKDVLQLLRYLTHLSRVWFSSQGIAVLADLTSADQEVVSLVLGLIHKLQASVGKIKVLYLILPENRSTKKHLAKEIQKLQKEGACHFQITLLRNTSDLQTYIDQSQLLAYFGGTLAYNHKAWVKLQMRLEDLDKLVENILAQLPQTLEKLNSLQRQVTSSLRANEDVKVQQVETKKSLIRKDLYLDEALKEADALLEYMNNPHLDGFFSLMSRQAVFKPMMSGVPLNYTKLLKAKRKLDNATKDCEVGLGTEGELPNVVLLENEMKKIISWIDLKGRSYLNSQTDVPETLREAQHLPIKFDREIYKQAKYAGWFFQTS
ncbi:probable guanine nucleotide exchange factor MCF2L2 [Actinia tenebrosa]|uniref:Probable guanine nucleotide exchange factor MCF2L2 n=1 Tax=Actinia tenebrosa TaxID=6105 RepID=A0A6P8H868_ACTTE|nr:probable guanine nucleotide exchange factor MCF2L2 [Actinia tenebrosa]